MIFRPACGRPQRWILAPGQGESIDFQFRLDNHQSPGWEPTWPRRQGRGSSCRPGINFDSPNCCPSYWRPQSTQPGVFLFWLLLPFAQSDEPGLSKFSQFGKLKYEIFRHMTSNTRFHHWHGLLFLVRLFHLGETGPARHSRSFGTLSRALLAGAASSQISYVVIYGYYPGDRIVI